MVDPLFAWRVGGSKMETMKLQYSSSSNISFRGEVDTGIEIDTWNAMTTEEKDDVITQSLFELVDIWEVDE